MSLKDLRAGIISQDWDSVKRAYESFTGDTLPENELVLTEKPKRGRKKKVEVAITPIKPTKVKKTNQKGFTLEEDTIERTNKPKFVTNLFTDYGDDPDPLSPEEAKILERVNSNRVVRKNELIKATCTQCHQVQEVRPILVAGKSMGAKYRCDRCISGG